MAGILQPHFLIQVSVVVRILIAQADQFRLIDAHLSSMNYDANKLPLGIPHSSMGVARLLIVLYQTRQTREVNDSQWICGIEGSLIIRKTFFGISI